MRTGATRSPSPISSPGASGTSDGPRTGRGCSSRTDPRLRTWSFSEDSAPRSRNEGKARVAQPKPGDPRGRAQSAVADRPYFFFVPFFLAAFFFAGIIESPPLTLD